MQYSTDLANVVEDRPSAKVMYITQNILSHHPKPLLNDFLNIPRDVLINTQAVTLRDFCQYIHAKVKNPLL